MMKKSVCIVLCALLIIVSGGIVQGEERNMPEELITPDRLLVLAGLTEDEVDIQDLPDVIAQYEITEELLNGMDQEEIKMAVQLSMKNLAKYDYSYLFDGEAITSEGKTPVFSSILRMAAYTDNDVLHPTWMIDFEKRRCYYSDGINFVSNIRNADLAFDLTDDFAAAVQAIIEKGDWAEWEYTYTGDTTEYGTYWQLAIETPEGVLRYSIQGFGSNAPEGLYDVSHEIYELFWAMQ